MKQANDISFELEAAGGPFHDPALIITPDNSPDSILMDSGTLHAVRTRSLMKIRWLFLSHLHIDHLIGFDHLLRVRLFSTLPLFVFGPPGTTEVISHRLQGYTWNLTSGSPFEVYSTDLTDAEQSPTVRFACHDRFAPSTPKPVQIPEVREHVRLQRGLTVHWHQVNHGVPCLCYRLDQSFPPQFSPQTCQSLGLRPGPWVSELTSGRPISQEVGGVVRDQDWLAARLLQKRPTESVGYLTDTLLESPLTEQLREFYRDVDVLVSESAYLREEAEAARQNLHMTTTQVASLARDCGAGKLFIFHLSRRHMEAGPQTHLDQVRTIFPDSELLGSMPLN
jgi:ribonuclease Z